MGFRAEVENFQPYYVHAKMRWKELRVGAAMLREAIALEKEKSSKLELILANERQAKESASAKVSVIVTSMPRRTPWITRIRLK
jgi:hypothetical protein